MHRTLRFLHSVQLRVPLRRRFRRVVPSDIAAVTVSFMKSIERLHSRLSRADKIATLSMSAMSIHDADGGVSIMVELGRIVHVLEFRV